MNYYNYRDELIIPEGDPFADEREELDQEEFNNAMEQYQEEGDTCYE